MKAVRFHQQGGPEVLIFEEVPDPTPGSDEVVIRVEAVGLNFSDVLRRRGDKYPEPTPMPFTLGNEVAGTIAALGKDVAGLKVGDEVYAFPRRGGYAQFIAVPAHMIIPVPLGIDAIQATTLMNQGLTAALALRVSARIAEGDSVLVEAAAGGVGSFAVQLARLFGADKIIAAASTEEKRKYAVTLGADAAVDYTAPGWANEVLALTNGRGVDIALEMVGGETVGQALDALGSFGRMVIYGQASGQSTTIDPQRLVAKNQSATGFYIGEFFKYPDLIQKTLAEIVAHVASGDLKLQVSAVLPLSQAPEAHRLLEGRRSTGKLVLQPWA